MADKIIVETELAIIGFAQPAGINPSQYAEDLVAKTLLCGELLGEYAFNEIFIEGTDQSIR